MIYKEYDSINKNSIYEILFIFFRVQKYIIFLTLTHRRIKIFSKTQFFHGSMNDKRSSQNSDSEYSNEINKNTQPMESKIIYEKASIVIENQEKDMFVRGILFNMSFLLGFASRMKAN